MIKQSVNKNRIVHTVWIISKDIGVKFGMDKCNTVRIKKRRIFDMEDIDVPDGHRMKNIEKVPINI